MNFIQLLLEAFGILRKEPKLFIPKLLISLLFGIEMLALAYLLMQIPEPLRALDVSSSLTLEQFHILRTIMPYYFLLMIYSFVVLILDILVNSMYPSMVDNFKKGVRVSFRSAFRHSIKRFKVVVPIIFITMAILFIPLYLIFEFLAKYHDPFSLSLVVLLFLVIYFLLSVIFYLLYPVSILEKRGVFSTLKRSLSLARLNFKNVSLASIFPMFLSFASFILSFYAAYYLSAFFIFIALRIFVALIYTYHMVLDPTIYIAARKTE